jgi:hypothetical protein
VIIHDETFILNDPLSLDAIQKVSHDHKDQERLKRRSNVKIFIEDEIFDRRPDKSGRITGQVRKTLLEPVRRVGHVRCQKPDRSVCKTGYSHFDRMEN